jgi:YegS/Rv2252/BmrU family lipid kinase
VRALVIINPIAGRRRRDKAPAVRADFARHVLGLHRVDPDIRLTEHAGHAEDLARRAAANGYDVVFAWGGDGTINEVARALASTGTALAIVPAGSGNGLARALRIPLDPARALAHAVNHPARRIDAGSLGGRFFVNVAGVGLDAEVASRFARRGTRRGALPYVSIAIDAGIRYRALEYTLDVAGDRRRERALIVALANSPQYGIGAVVAPNASLHDGLLDVVVVRDRPLVGRVAGARHLFTRTLHRARGVVTRQVSRLVIEADVPLMFHVDGDPAEGSNRLDGVVHPGALRIRA